MAIMLTQAALPSDEDTALAKAASHALACANEKSVRVQVAAAGREITSFELPPLAARLLTDILKETAAGHAVTLLPLQEEVTTQQAAALLNVSRPYLIGMIDRGELPARLVGNQRRLPLKDVLVYKEQNSAKRLESLKELVAQDQKLGLFKFE